KTFVADLERFAVVALASAGVALDIHVGQEMHLDAENAITLASFTAPAFDVEREAAWFVAAGARIGQSRIQLPEVSEDPSIGGGVRARRAPDGRLIDADDLVDVLQALDRVAGPHPARGAVELGAYRAEQRVHDQAALARTANARHRRNQAERHLDGHVLQVVGASATHDELRRTRSRALSRNR